MKFTINRRWYSSLPSIEVEIGAEFENASNGVKIGAALKVAFKSGAVLRGADLHGAFLSGAYLSDADLSGADLSGADLSGAYLSGADLHGAFLSGAYLSDAVLRDADLRGALLSGADLSGADLSDADLSGADLSGAVLRGADLSGTDLHGAFLSGAYLSDADLSGAVLRWEDVPAIPNIDAAILKAIEAGGELKMSDWHTCETTHCRAGWAVHLAGVKGYALEKEVGSSAAGALIYAKSTPDNPIPNFYASDDDAMADIRERAAKRGTTP